MGFKSFDKMLKRLRTAFKLDMTATMALRGKCKLEGWASVYVYPKNQVKVSKTASVRLVNGLLDISKPWFDVQPMRKCVFEMEENSQLECLGNFDFTRSSKCVVKKGASLHLGNNSRIGTGSIVECSNEISIGDGVWISDNVIISDVNGKIVIEDGVWIGNGAQISGNVRIGRNAVIGEGVNVTENVEQNAVLKRVSL